MLKEHDVVTGEQQHTQHPHKHTQHQQLVDQNQPRTAAFYETKARKWETRGNWNKAQKQRAKAWKLDNPQYAASDAPLFYNNGVFLGYDHKPFTSGTSTAPSSSYTTPDATSFVNTGAYTTTAGSTYTPTPTTTTFVESGTNYYPVATPTTIPGGSKYETRALDYETRGKTAKALKNREKLARSHSHHHTNIPATERIRTYEQKAQKWEQRQNWNKAQKQRAKVWRIHNNMSSSVDAPLFYNNGVFLGYNA